MHRYREPRMYAYPEQTHATSAVAALILALFAWMIYLLASLAVLSELAEGADKNIRTLQESEVMVGAGAMMIMTFFGQILAFLLAMRGLFLPDKKRSVAISAAILAGTNMLLVAGSWAASMAMF